MSNDQDQELPEIGEIDDIFLERFLEDIDSIDNNSVGIVAEYRHVKITHGGETIIEWDQDLFDKYPDHVSDMAFQMAEDFSTLHKSGIEALKEKVSSRTSYLGNPYNIPENEWEEEHD